ncbi:uncharacterized protein LOC120551889 [Perca fluviatilis]|uniref:uncharacterized protein LOC120551889 n=1 Tax=Perca fluviatilis TaxID=8168 RepID=UPI0019629DA1|nr:uncharacterized protein LOC120551889 [Perca fluviatilis]
MSTSFGEWRLDDPKDDPKDDSYKPPSDTSPSDSGSASTSSHGSINGWSERKWIVDESSIMQMFQTCCLCGMPVAERKSTKHGSQLKIHWTCLQGHNGLWQSCPDQRKMGRNNLLTSAAILFTGATYADIRDWAFLLKLQIPGKTQFYSVQSKYLIPVINHAYKNQQDQVIERLKQLADTEEKIALAGDARCDSPGFSAKYSTYSFMDDATKEIVHFELVQVTEASSSVAMEAIGFKRGLDHLLTMGVDVGVITTDRAPSIRKIMRETYNDIRHEFDAWHVNKSVKKKLVNAANKRKTKTY